MRKNVLARLLHGSPLAASLSLSVAAWALGGCSLGKKPSETPFSQRRTHTGEVYCSDMPVVFNGDHEPDRPFHRVATVRTSPIETTAPERLQLLREIACEKDGDAVIDAGDYDGNAADGKRVKFLAGTVVQWIVAMEPSGGRLGSQSRATPAAPSTEPAAITAPASAAPSPSPSKDEPAAAADEGKAKKKKKKTTVTVTSDDE